MSFAGLEYFPQNQGRYQYPYWHAWCGPSDLFVLDFSAAVHWLQTEMQRLSLIDDHGR